MLLLEDKGTVSSLQYTQTVQRKRAMVGICFSSEHLAQKALHLFKLLFWVVARMQKPAPVGSWEHELFCLVGEAAVCSSEQPEATASAAQAGFARFCCYVFLTLIVMHLFNLPCSW